MAATCYRLIISWLARGAVFFDVQRAMNRIYLFIEWGRGEAQSIRWHWPPLKGGVAKLKPVLPEPFGVVGLF